MSWGRGHWDRRVSRGYRADGPREGLDRDKAIDWLWAVTSDELYNALVSDRGWRVAEYREWLHRLIRATLLED